MAWRRIATESDESSVLVLYTGGTIGMVKNENGVLAPVSDRFVTKLRQSQQMHDAEYGQKIALKYSEPPLVLPKTGEKRRVLYRVIEYQPLMDSSNMTMDDWITIAKDIRDYYEDYDGFIVLHGTDTLTYTASALSFMLENLGKTVIITGSQVPIFEARSDGMDNFLVALAIAGNYVIPEVTVYFGDKLFRGNRTTKVCSDRYDAFDSPNVPPIATVGIRIEVDFKRIFWPNRIERFCVHCKLDRNVGLLKIFPSITIDTVNAFLKPPIAGVVLQTYGSGNMPCNRPDILQALKKATDKGVIIVNCTQCIRGGVSDLYETNNVLSKAGVIPGYDLTPEAALTKLAYVLSKTEWGIEQKRQMIQNNLRGELTKPLTNDGQLQDLIDAVTSSIKLKTIDEVQNITKVFLPALIAEAIAQQDLQRLNQLERMGGDFSAPNTDLRTPLHLACCEGHVEIVEYLLNHGASVHMKDRFNRTPIHDAITFDHHQIIRLLRKCGAHLHDKDTKRIGEEICKAAATGNVKRLTSYQLAGVTMDLQNLCGRTPLHLAVLYNQEESVKFLLKAKVQINVSDLLGNSALSIAQQKNLQNIVLLIMKKIESEANSKTHNGINGNHEIRN